MLSASALCAPEQADEIPAAALPFFFQGNLPTQCQQASGMGEIFAQFFLVFLSWLLLLLTVELFPSLVRALDGGGGPHTRGGSAAVRAEL